MKVTVPYKIKLPCGRILKAGNYYGEMEGDNFIARVPKRAFEGKSGGIDTVGIVLSPWEYTK